MSDQNCLIVPTYESADIATKTVSELIENQTTEDFDIILVDCGSEDHKVLEKKFNNEERVEVIHKKEDLGGSGSFYYGFEMAKEEKYENIFFSDNDAVPESRDLMEKLVSNLNESNYVFPTNKDYDTENWVPFHYLGVKRHNLENIDFPKDFFIHNDDFFLIKQLERNGLERKKLEAEYSHPMGFPRIYFLIRNSLWLYCKGYTNFRHFSSDFIMSVIQAAYLDKEGFSALKDGLKDGANNVLGANFENGFTGINASEGQKVKRNNLDATYITGGKEDIPLNFSNQTDLNIFKDKTFFGKLKTLFRNKVAVDSGFHLFSISLLLSEKTFFVERRNQEVHSYKMPLKKRLITILIIPLIFLSPLVKIYHKLMNGKKR